MITSVSYRKSGSPQPEAYKTSGTFVRLRKANSVEPYPIPSYVSSSTSSTPPSSKIYPSNKSFSSFLQNLFRGRPPIPITNSTTNNGNNHHTPLERSRSSETINSICSTNSFSFVSSPRKYKGRKKGKRIPISEDTLLRSPKSNGKRKISTLTRIGMKIGLKSKYNLQSCESLHRLNSIDLNNSSNTNTLNRTIRKRRAPLPPGGVQLVNLPISVVETEPQNLPSTSTHVHAQVHRRCFSEGNNDYSGYMSPKSRYHVRGKRRAPVPPNPFGDPNAQEITNDIQLIPEAVIKLPFVSENDEIDQSPKNSNEKQKIHNDEIGCSKIKTKSPRNSYVEKEVQSDQLYLNTPSSNSLVNHEKIVNDEVIAQLALLKSEADASPLRLIKPNQSNKIKSKSLCDSTSENGDEHVILDKHLIHTSSGMDTPVKLAPRPWYKRSSSKNSSSSSNSNNNSPAGHSKKNTKPTMMLLAKFSDLDREASRIVEENRRRSAEIAYNETAKELITMFNEFNINQQTVSVGTSSSAPLESKKPSVSNSTSDQVNDTVDKDTNSSKETQNTKPTSLITPVPSCSVKTQQNDISTLNNPGKNPMSEEPKKLAVVQPQSNPRKLATIGVNTTTTLNTSAAIPSRLIENRVTPISNSTNTPIQLGLIDNLEGWFCPRCTLENDSWRTFCDACHYRNSTGSTVQSITSLFENVNKQNEMRTIDINPPIFPLHQNVLPPLPLITIKPEIPLTLLDTGSNRRKKPAGFPPCENFLSQLPSKEKLAKEEKLVGIKLLNDPEIEELNIEKLREARVAFFEKNKYINVNDEMKPNNLTCTETTNIHTNSRNNENIYFDHENNDDNDNDDALDTLLDIHQQLNPNMSGTGPQTWKPFNVQKFKPMLESIVESSYDHYGSFNPIYENMNLKNDNDSQESLTNSFMQNVQIQLKDHIHYFEHVNSSGDNTSEENDNLQIDENMDGNKKKLSLDEYRKLGAIPKYYQNQNHGTSSSKKYQQQQLLQSSEINQSQSTSSNTNNSQMNFDKSNEKSTFIENTFAISKLLRNLEWAIAKGDHRLAASLAHDLAIFKVNCVVSKATEQIVIRVYVEDRFMQQGPFQVQVTSSTRVKELKAKIECDWGIPMNFQKWILGRKIAEDDSQTLSFYEIVNDSMAFLYLVTPGSETDTLANDDENPENKTLTHVSNRAKQESSAKQNVVHETKSQISQPVVVERETNHQMKMSPSQNVEMPISIKEKNKIHKLNDGEILGINNNIKAVAVPQIEMKPKVTETNINQKSYQPNQIISKTSKVNVEEIKSNEKKIDNIIYIPEPQKAQIRFGVLAEATCDILQTLPEIQNAQIKPTSPDLVTFNIRSENIKQINVIDGTPIQQIQSNISHNQNVIANTTEITNKHKLKHQSHHHHSSLEKKKSIKAGNSKNHSTQLDMTKFKKEPHNFEDSSPNTTIEKPRRKKFFKMNVKKVDQGTSIERNAPIRIENKMETLPVTPVASTKSTSPSLEGLTQKDVVTSIVASRNVEISSSPEELVSSELSSKDSQSELVLKPMTIVPKTILKNSVTPFIQNETSPAINPKESSSLLYQNKLEKPNEKDDNFVSPIIQTGNGAQETRGTSDTYSSIKTSDDTDTSEEISKILVTKIEPTIEIEPTIQIEPMTNTNTVELIEPEIKSDNKKYNSNFGKPLPIKNQFGKNIGNIFMSRVVGNLIAANEDMNRNKRLENIPSIPRKNSNTNSGKINLNENVSQIPIRFQGNSSILINEKTNIPHETVWASTGKSEVETAVVGSSTRANAKIKVEQKENNFQTYKRMLQLMENEDFIKTSEEVDCPICISKIPPGEGITLRDCLHSFCTECVVGAVQYSEEPQVRCPFRDNIYSCDSYMQEREVKGLVPSDLYNRHLARSVKLAESKMSNAFHCKTNDCTGWCIFEDDVNLFNCPVCKKRNCLTCQAIHEGQNCQEHQRQLAIAAETDEDAKSSRLMLEKMISRGEALDCPACHVVLLKKWGCDWVRCSYCKTEICWVTKGFRWGPNGKGDISGGCKCGINGVRCHPKCTYCH